MSEKKELNPQYIIASLRNQVNDLSYAVAEREALVEQLGQELNKLKEDKTDE